jgi:hypothetical protein
MASEEFERDMLPLTMATPGGCDAAADDLRLQAFPEKEWRQSGVKAWLVDATQECTDKLLGTVRHGLVAMTFGSTPSRVPGGRALQLFTLGAGVFPLGMARRGADDVDALVDRLGGSVDFWTALGRDAAILASRALATVPADSSEDRQVAQRRRDAVRQALEGVRVGLWTADAQGFSATHRVERSLSVVRLTRGMR